MNNAALHKTYLYPLPAEQAIEPIMRFVLTYNGPLRPSNSDREQKIASHKQEIRKVFHTQLRELWSVDRVLSNFKICRSCKIDCRVIHESDGELGGCVHDLPLVEYLSSEFQRNDYKFVPLVCKDFDLLCSIKILFLRKDKPGSVIQAGDLDNRIKTLIDGLRMPENKSELGEYESPDDDEEPFYCLLDDDKRVTALSVETDVLLVPDAPRIRSDGSKKTPKEKEIEEKTVSLVVTVELKPYAPTKFNMAFF